MSDKLDPAKIKSLLTLSDGDLITAMTQDPDFFKRAQKAMAEAKKREAEKKRLEGQEASAQGGPAHIDPKAYLRARRLVEGPFNDENLGALADILKEASPDSAPPGEPSLMTAAFNYLGTKERVELQWPAALADLGARAGESEIGAMQALYAKRSYGLDGRSASLPGLLFSREGDWAEIEKKLSFPLAAFLKGQVGHRHQSGGWNATNWSALKNLVEAGCEQPAASGSYGLENWQELAQQELGPPGSDKASERARASEPRRECFRAMVAAGWIQTGCTPLTDSLRFAGSSQNYNMQNTCSRAFLTNCALDETAIEIFSLLCDEEDSRANFSRYDSVGRSRLYFINERARSVSFQQAPTQGAVCMQLIQECLDRGDPPISVNAQNPLAKAANDKVAGMLRSQIERLELAGAASADGAAPAPRKSSGRI